MLRRSTRSLALGGPALDLARRVEVQVVAVAVGASAHIAATGRNLLGDTVAGLQVLHRQAAPTVNEAADAAIATAATAPLTREAAAAAAADRTIDRLGILHHVQATIARAAGLGIAVIIIVTTTAVLPARHGEVEAAKAVQAVTGAVNPGTAYGPAAVTSIAVEVMTILAAAMGTAAGTVTVPAVMAATDTWLQSHIQRLGQ